MMTPNELWASRQESSEDARREFERERLMVWTLDALAELIQEADISRADLARKLGTSRAHVTQVFAGSRNVTLSTISDFAWACGKRAVVKFEPLRSGQFISHPMQVPANLKPAKVVMLAPQQAPSVRHQHTQKAVGEL